VANSLSRFRLLGEYALVALIALAFSLAPRGDATLNVILSILSIVFFAAIAVLGFRLYRQQHFLLDSLTTVQRGVLYGSIGLAFLAFTAMPRMFDLGGGGILAWIGLLALCSAGVFWVLVSARRYD
jgi:hypothetical protein